LVTVVTILNEIWGCGWPVRIVLLAHPERMVLVREGGSIFLGRSGFHGLLVGESF
jgi:hypothetical protein